MQKTLPEKVASLDWNCWEAETQYLTHAIHRYSGKFIPQIARQAVELVTEPGEVVLDPYCGSGTTLLECLLSNRRSIGVDLNPLAVLISHVKTTPIEEKTIQDFVVQTEDYLASVFDHTGSLFGSSQNTPYDARGEAKKDWRYTDPWFNKWFQKETLCELICIHQKLIHETNVHCRNIGLLAFSDILRKCSNAHHSYPNVMFDKTSKQVPAAVPEFLRRLKEVSSAVVELWSVLKGPVLLPRVILGDARALPIPDSSIDSIVTHPPYIGSIPYAEYGLLSLVWLGHDPRKLDFQLTGGRRQSPRVVERFKEGFADMLCEAGRVLKPGKIMALLVGNPLVKGNRVDLAEMAKSLAPRAGFHCVVAHTRAGTNRRANLMGEESLLFFQRRTTQVLARLRRVG